MAAPLRQNRGHASTA